MTTILFLCIATTIGAKKPVADIRMTDVTAVLSMSEAILDRVRVGRDKPIECVYSLSGGYVSIQGSTRDIQANHERGSKSFTLTVLGAATEHETLSLRPFSGDLAKVRAGLASEGKIRLYRNPQYYVASFCDNSGRIIVASKWLILDRAGVIIARGRL